MGVFAPNLQYYWLSLPPLSTLANIVNAVGKWKPQTSQGGWWSKHRGKICLIPKWQTVASFF